MKGNKNEKLRYVIAREFLKQRPQAEVNKLVEIIGLELFSALLLSEGLQGKHMVFPKWSTLKRLVIRAKIKDELKGLKKGSWNYEIKMKEITAMFDMKPNEILRLMKKIK